MMRKSMLAVLALATITPLLGAQETPRPRRTPRPDARAFSFSYSGNRARIGVLVNTTANSETDRLGAKIDGVTPGGPAEKAGLKAGDIITRFNGTSLAGASADVDESGPGHKLIELVGALDPGDTVRVDYRRGSETKTASIVTDEQNTIWRGEGPAIAEFDQLRRPMALMREGFGFCFGDAWCDLDLVTVSPDLGAYFGTREGILVVRAASDSALPLKGGDVILAIGGRKPTSPAHAMRILRSYDEGESVSIEIMRHERRQTINWTVPEAESGWRRRDPRGRGEQSFWRVEPDIEALTAPAMEEAQRSMEDLLRRQERLKSQQLRALRSVMRRSSTAL
jgi:C-terminal processing protease CtpA/Prc